MSAATPVACGAAIDVPLSDEPRALVDHGDPWEDRVERVEAAQIAPSIGVAARIASCTVPVALVVTARRGDLGAADAAVVRDVHRVAGVTDRSGRRDGDRAGQLGRQDAALVPDRALQ